MSVPGEDLLKQIEDDNPKLGMYLRNYLVPALQTTAQNAAVDTDSEIPAPQPPESISVRPAQTGDMLQVVVNHTAPIIKGAHYIYHLATNPQFTGAQIEPKPATRAPAHFTAPTFQSDGSTKHNYYLAVQVQYPGSPPSAPTFYGGVSPASFQLNGTAAADIQPGTGSGTAQNGGQALVGLGVAQVRLRQGAKRSV